MIAACPRCQARYRVERERLTGDGLRVRCARCSAVFRVRPPASLDASSSAPPSPRAEPVAPPSPSAAPVARPSPSAVPPPATARAARRPESEASRPLALVGLASGERAKECLDLLGRRYECACFSDGGDLLLECQRRWPDLVVLGEGLARLDAAEIVELLKRNDSLSRIRVIAVGMAPRAEGFGPDDVLAEGELPDSLGRLLDLEPEPAPRPNPAGQAADLFATPEAPAGSSQGHALDDFSFDFAGADTRSPEPGSEPARPRPAPAAPAVAPPVSPPGQDPMLAERRSEAERLARIVVSDIVLYNEAKFLEAVRTGDVAQALSAELEEGRALFRTRIDPRILEERDFLVEELRRVAAARTAP